MLIRMDEWFIHDIYSIHIKAHLNDNRVGLLFFIRKMLQRNSVN